MMFEDATRNIREFSEMVDAYNDMAATLKELGDRAQAVIVKVNTMNAAISDKILELEKERAKDNKELEAMRAHVRAYDDTHGTHFDDAIAAELKEDNTLADDIEYTPAFRIAYDLFNKHKHI